MKIVREIFKDFAIYFSPWTQKGKIRLGAVVLLLVIGAFLVFSDDTAPDLSNGADAEIVTLAAAGSLGSGDRSFRTIGTVRAVSEARLQTESAGRITSVNVEIGDHVAAGTVLASIENAREYAALLQSEGAYEAAIASAAQSEIGVSGAQTDRVAARNAAISVFRSAYNTANSAVLNHIDNFFSNPDSGSTPGLRLDGYGYTADLNDERVAFRSILDEWRMEASELTVNDNLQNALRDAEDRTNRLLQMVDIFIILLNDQEPPLSYTEAELATYSTTFTTLRAELNTTLLAIQSARTSLESAEEALARAEISGSERDISIADAQVKQALGGLRAAQAAYENTLVRTPIAGVVNALYLRENEYVGMAAPAAVVANNNALSITTSISEMEREAIAVEDTVRIEDESIGVITAIAPAIDPISGKIEVRIGITDDSNISNGDTVAVTFIAADHGTIETEELLLPLEAIKMTPDGATVFTVSDDKTLVAIPIELARISGGFAVVENGIDATTKIVTDARGLTEGTTVTISTE